MQRDPKFFVHVELIRTHISRKGSVEMINQIGQGQVNLPYSQGQSWTNPPSSTKRQKLKVISFEILIEFLSLFPNIGSAQMFTKTGRYNLIVSLSNSLRSRSTSFSFLINYAISNSIVGVVVSVPAPNRSCNIRYCCRVALLVTANLFQGNMGPSLTST